MRRSHDLLCVILTLAATVLAPPSLEADEETMITGFESENWTMTNGRIVDHLGRKALAGSAILKDVDFTDGVIEVRDRCKVRQLIRGNLAGCRERLNVSCWCIMRRVRQERRVP